MVYDGHLTIVPGDRDRIPTRSCDSAAISGIASPINTAALLEAFRFGGRHCCGSHQLAAARNGTPQPKSGTRAGSAPIHSFLLALCSFGLGKIRILPRKP